MKDTKPTGVGHDNPYPEELLRFMLTKWKPETPKKQPRIKGIARFRARRSELSERFPDDVILVPAGGEKVRANDTHFRFRPSSNFYYLTGSSDADCVLAMIPGRSGQTGHQAILYAPPNNGRADATFFTDRHRGEFWVGQRPTLTEYQERYELDGAKPLDELDALLQRATESKKFRLTLGIEPKLDSLALGDAAPHQELLACLSEQRMIKDAIEVAAHERATLATRLAFESVISSMRTATTERELEGVFVTKARVEGNDVGYNVIAASGPNACVLHWQKNDGYLRKSDLLLLDAGVESREFYTADVTRTLPLSGKFSPAQRTVYDLVADAQAAAIAQVKPGNDFLAPHRAAMRVLAEGLRKFGILKAPLDEVLRDDTQTYRRYTLHSTSHMLGLDVHDCADARPEVYRQGKLKLGMVLTVEPGLYFQRDDLTVPARFRGIGVRIEDDVLVTSRGCRLLSDLPRTSVDVERWIQKVWSKK